MLHYQTFFFTILKKLIIFALYIIMMNRRIFFSQVVAVKCISHIFLLFVVFLGACTNRVGSVIEGTLSSDRYDNEWVYWVPFADASPKTVDSALIQNNAFRLVVSAHNLNKTGIIRIRYQLRLGVQDLIVFTEPGTLHVHLDSVSRATGTPLNDVLQHWKEKKQSYDAEIFALNRKRRAAEADDEKDRIREDIDNAAAAYRDDMYQIVVENIKNEAGKFIYSMHKGQFTEEQINEIED